VQPRSHNLRALPTLAVAVVFLCACAAPAATPVEEPTAAPLSSPTLPAGRIRPPAVAGSWYPGDPDELAQMVDGMLAAVQPVDGAPISLVVPHAGYAYSGPVAAVGFRQLENGEYDVAVIIASDHQLPLSDPISVWAEGGFETPLGVVPVDVDLAQELLEADPRITFDPAAHEGEHVIEIELPFLQRVCPHCRIVPVLMSTEDEATVQSLADALLETLPDRRAVVIASSDLSHYPPQEQALVVDGATLAAIETGDPEPVREAIAASMAAGIPNLATCACGLGPILVAMRVAEGLGADASGVLRYATSASTSGDPTQVVGYGAVMLWRYEPPDPTPEQQEELLALAHETLERYLVDETVPEYATSDPLLTRPAGVFVTLEKSGELRGCIGHFRADLPLYQAVQQMAVAAATEDPRFPPITQEELPDVTVEISILSPFRRVADVSEIQVGTHGLMVLAAGRSGLLLPQVPVDEGWDREAFLEGLCHKAGLPGSCWQEGASLYAFTAVVFGGH
jgi:AmmeMemoRadiSam system protein B/AmmeMemoRadiSam system protein A